MKVVPQIAGVHYLAIGVDVIAGLALLVIGIVSLTGHSSGIELNSAAQWALVGTGSANIGLLLVGVGLIVKKALSPPITIVNRL